MDTLIGAYIGVGGVILGALLAGPITYYYSQKLIAQTHQNAIEAIHITEFNKAAAAFHAEFADVIFYLRRNIEDPKRSKKYIFSIINTKDLIRYERALIIFEPFLDRRQIEGFRQTWKAYKDDMKACEQEHANPDDPANTDWISHYVATSHEGLNLNQKYLGHINSLLEYAKQK